MSIMSVLMAIGVWGMVILRYTIQIEQATDTFVTTLKSTQNMARNSVISTVREQQLIDAGDTNSFLKAKVDGFAIFWDENKYSIHYCIKQSLFSRAQFDCSGVEKENIQPAQFSEISLTSIDEQGLSTCKGIMFERLTGNIFAMNDFITSPDDIGSCKVTLQHDSFSISKLITIDLEKDNVSY